MFFVGAVLLALLPTFRTQLAPTCPSKIYCQGDLLHDCQLANIYRDSKHFVDLKLTKPEKEVLEEFRKLKDAHNGSIPKENIKTFIEGNFEECAKNPECKELEVWLPPDWKERPRILDLIRDQKYQKWADELNKIWKDLSRKMSKNVQRDKSMTSLMYLPNGFVIPGGRFTEMYYWDNYWIIKGLLTCDMFETAKGVIENFFELIRKLGHIPNGSRVYYEQRSQPPLLTLMVDAYARFSGDEKFINKQNIELLDKELMYFIKNRQVQVRRNGTIHTLYRYYAPSSGPRPESYKEDYLLANDLANDRDKTKLYINIKSAAESGWDFSSRWFIAPDGTNNGTLADMQTEHIIPVDLNAILFGCFDILSNWFQRLGDYQKYWFYRLKAIEVGTGIEKVLWSSKHFIWFDYDNLNGKQREYFYISNFTPLWTGAHRFQRRALSRHMIRYMFSNGLDKFPGGTPQSLLRTGEQWDFPNAWAPSQAILIQGLQKLGTREAEQMAAKLAEVWVKTNFKAFEKSGKMYEKYNAEEFGFGGGGGEYEPQEGFGWSNGVIFELLAYYGREFKSGIRRKKRMCHFCKCKPKKRRIGYFVRNISLEFEPSGGK